MSRTARRGGPPSIQSKMRKLAVAFVIPAMLVLAVILGLMMAYSKSYQGLLHNVTTVSEFNQDFKELIDLKMYYYVIESQYSEGLPLAEVENAKTLARNLLDTTVEKESRLAISSVLDLCETLEEKILQVDEIQSYDERQVQLENNIYVLTSLIQEYMNTYLYHEAVHLNAVQTQLANGILQEIILIAAVMAGLMLVLTQQILRLGRSITLPIVDLSARVEAISAGDLSVRIPMQTGMREIRMLTEGVEQMVERLNAQIEENTQKQATLRRTELALLQAQVSPHFLYNTMDTIIWLIEAEKLQEAVEMVSNLSIFFRHSLSKGCDIITMQEEERHVRSYLQIQQVRYQDILQYTIDIDPALCDVPISKLTLQPLVENALYHGIKPKRGLGHIRITGRIEQDAAILQVEDDGVGMSEERLAQLRESIDRGERVGFGLSTVHERIGLLFAPGYALPLDSREGRGTIVSIRIPKISGKEGNTI